MGSGRLYRRPSHVLAGDGGLCRRRRFRPGCFGLGSAGAGRAFPPLVCLRRAVFRSHQRGPRRRRPECWDRRLHECAARSRRAACGVCRRRLDCRWRRARIPIRRGSPAFGGDFGAPNHGIPDGRRSPAGSGGGASAGERRQPDGARAQCFDGPFGRSGSRRESVRAAAGRGHPACDSGHGRPARGQSHVRAQSGAGAESRVGIEQCVGRTQNRRREPIRTGEPDFDVRREPGRDSQCRGQRVEVAQRFPPGFERSFQQSDRGFEQ